MRLLLSAFLLAVSAPLYAQSAAVATTGGGHGRSSASVTAAFGRTVRINDLVLRPVAVIEDSRCPPNVNCVWAGRLVIELERGSPQRIRLDSGKPLAIAGGRLTLVDANGPAPAGTKMPPPDYRFQLRFERP